MRRCAKAWLFGAALAASALGCRSCDRVESELRARETDLREAREELDRSHAINQGLMQELQSLHGDPSNPCPSGACDKPVAAYPIRSLALGRQTGGYDAGDCPGDQALQVIVEPLDADNQAVKVPGSLVVQALEITAEGVKRPLSTWQIPEEDLRRAWRSGLLSTGYSVILPWKLWPSTEKLRVVVQFRTPDGRAFEADKDVTVRLTPPAARPPAPPIVPAPPPAPPAPPPHEAPLLPPPKLLDPPAGGPQLDPPAILKKPVPADAAPRNAAWWDVSPAPSAGVRPAAQLLRPVRLPDGK